MLHDKWFSSSFNAWCEMDKQLHTQFINHPFTIDPTSSTYIHLLECTFMDSFLSHCSKSQQIFESHHSFRHYPPYQPPPTDTGSPSSSRYALYDKPQCHGEGKKPALCLQSGIYGHCMSSCSSPHPSRLKQPFICEWKGNKILSNKNKLICVMYNVRGLCTDPPTNSHGEHSCSLCGDSHLASHCTRN